MTDTTETRVSERADSRWLKIRKQMDKDFRGGADFEAMSAHLDGWAAYIATLERQRDVLLDAAKCATRAIFEMEDMDHVERMEWFESHGLDLYDQLRAAIAQVEGEQ